MNLLKTFLPSRLLKASIRIKVTLIFILPMLAALSALSYFHNVRESKELESMVEKNTIELGNMALASIHHGMMNNDTGMINQALLDIKEHSPLERIWIVDNSMKVMKSADPTDIGKILLTNNVGCVECHAYAPSERPRAMRITLDNSFLRVSAPIQNDVECRECHRSNNLHLGVLLMDMPLENIDEHIREDMIYNIIVSLLSVVFVIVIAYFMIQWLVVRRVETIFKALSAFKERNFSARVKMIWRTEDELTKLAENFNGMAEALEHYEMEQYEVNKVRQEAIFEERERLALELHDGISQLLAYLKTKITAVRLLLKQPNTNAADVQLMDMEEIIVKQSDEVRSAIAGLKTIWPGQSGLSVNLTDFVRMYNRLSDLQINLDIDPAVGLTKISPEAEFQLARITQEAINNIRKHAHASNAVIKLWIEDQSLVLDISDNGTGFDPWQISNWRPPHFGLNSIGERAEKIGASLKIESRPGKGTHILVNLKLEKK
jgi:signal transduction histidine kinase